MGDVFQIQGDAFKNIENSVIVTRGGSLNVSVGTEKPKRTLIGRTVPALVVAQIKARTVKPLTVTMWNPDAETREYARSIWDAARALGFDVPAFPGVLQTPDSLVEVEVHSTESSTDDPLRAFASWIASVGYAVRYKPSSPENVIYVGGRAD